MKLHTIHCRTYVITEKLNGKPKNYMSKRMHKQLRWKSKIEQEINNMRSI